MESRSSSSARMRTLTYMPVVEVQGYNSHNKLQVRLIFFINSLGVVFLCLRVHASLCSNFSTHNQLYRVGRDSFSIKGRTCVRRHSYLKRTNVLSLWVAGRGIFTGHRTLFFPPAVHAFIPATYNSRRFAINDLYWYTKDVSVSALFKNKKEGKKTEGSGWGRQREHSSFLSLSCLYIFCFSLSVMFSKQTAFAFHMEDDGILPPFLFAAIFHSWAMDKPASIS